MNKFRVEMNRHPVLKAAVVKTVCPRPTLSHLYVGTGAGCHPQDSWGQPRATLAKASVQNKSHPKINKINPPVPNQSSPVASYFLRAPQLFPSLCLQRFGFLK